MPTPSCAVPARRLAPEQPEQQDDHDDQPAQPDPPGLPGLGRRHGCCRPRLSGRALGLESDGFEAGGATVGGVGGAGAAVFQAGVSSVGADAGGTGGGASVAAPAAGAQVGVAKVGAGSERPRRAEAPPSRRLPPAPSVGVAKVGAGAAGCSVAKRSPTMVPELAEEIVGHLLGRCPGSAASRSGRACRRRRPWRCRRRIRSAPLLGEIDPLRRLWRSRRHHLCLRRRCGSSSGRFQIAERDLAGERGADRADLGPNPGFRSLSPTLVSSSARYRRLEDLRVVQRLPDPLARCWDSIFTGHVHRLALPPLLHAAVAAGVGYRRLCGSSTATAGWRQGMDRFDQPHGGLRQPWWPRFILVTMLHRSARRGA